MFLLSLMSQTVGAQETATGGVNGQEVQLAEGQTVAVGTPVDVNGELWCEFPSITIGTKNGPDVVEAEVVATITEDCSFVISSIDRQFGGSSALASTRYRGGAWAGLYDVINALLVESYADMHYYDYGSSVSGGHQYYTYCYKKPWWNLNWSSWNWNPNGPSSVSIWKLCNASAFGYTVTIDATFYGWPGGAWNHYCDISGGIPQGHLSCDGSHWVA